MSEFVFERFAQTLSANQPLKVVIRASELRVIAAMWPLTVIFYRRGHAVGSASGVLAGDYFRGTEFDAFEVLNGANAQAVVIGVSSGAAGSDRITGSVEVIDGGKSRVLAGVTYWGKAGTAGVAGQYSLAQLWNPAGSGKNLIVEKIATYTTSAAYSQIGFGFGAEMGAPNVAPGNKKSDGPPSVALAKSGTAAAPPALSNLGSMIIRAQTLEQYDFTEPIIVAPGVALTTYNATLGSALEANFEFYEESAT